MDFIGFLSMVIYVFSLLHTQCLRYNICSAWFLDIRISTCFWFTNTLFGKIQYWNPTHCLASSSHTTMLIIIPLSYLLVRLIQNYFHTTHKKCWLTIACLFITVLCIFLSVKVQPPSLTLGKLIDIGTNPHLFQIP